MEIKDFPNYLIFRNGSILAKGNHRIKNQYSKPHFLKIDINTNGYKSVHLHNDGKKKHLFIHRLLAEHFIPNPENKPTVDHINRIRGDNRLCNLRWATSKEQRENQNPPHKYKSNKSGHKYICYANRDKNHWIFSISKIKQVRKQFKSKTDALCYKYIILLRIKANHF